MKHQSTNRQYRRDRIRPVIDDTGKVIGHVKKTWEVG